MKLNEASRIFNENYNKSKSSSNPTSTGNQTVVNNPNTPKPSNPNQSYQMPNRDGVSDYQLSEIQRKAQSGEKLMVNTPAKDALYNYYRGLNSPQQGNNSTPVQPVYNNGPFNGQDISGTSNQTPKDNYTLNTYNTGVDVSDEYMNKARDTWVYAQQGEPYSGFRGNSYSAGGVLGNDELREFAYYLQEQDRLSSSLDTNDANTYKNFYAIQDFINHKFGVNGTNDTMINGLSRADLGFNEMMNRTTMNENQIENQLMEMGYDAQTAMNMARGMNGFNKIAIQDGVLMDTGESRGRNPFDNLADYNYFNMADNSPGARFAWMDYLNPTALMGGSRTEAYDSSDYTDWDYYWATELAPNRKTVNWGDQVNNSAIENAMKGSSFYDLVANLLKGGS